MKTKNIRSKKLIIVLISLISLCLLVCLAFFSIIPRQYVTTSIDDYGVYTGNYDNEFPNEFITSFFPDKIELNFKDIAYSYRAQKSDTYAFEAYLEFTIEEENEFKAFVDTISNDMVSSEFSYDTNFTQYIVSDEFVPSFPDTEHETDLDSVSIRFAKIGKILYSDKDNRIIFVAIGVYDGGVAKTDFLNTYFDRFDINPVEYAENLLT